MLILESLGLESFDPKKGQGGSKTTYYYDK
jgi:hypothetical protein